MSGGQETDAVRFAGYAAVFNRLDQGGDVIAPGAFAASLARTGGALPLLWQHRADQQIGQLTLAREDERGLRVIGEISGGSAVAQQARALVRDGKLDGLSFGYRVVAAEGQRPRRLDALDLVEVSLRGRCWIGADYHARIGGAGAGDLHGWHGERDG